jgi:hypothetical protein
MVGEKPQEPCHAARARHSYTVLCVPELKFEPVLSEENLFDPPRVVELENGTPTDTVRLEQETAFKMIFTLNVPTEIPRVELTLEAIWTPFAGTSENLFTGRTAEELGVEEVADNPVELEAEVNFALLAPAETGGWLDDHFGVAQEDLLSGGHFVAGPGRGRPELLAAFGRRGRREVVARLAHRQFQSRP